MTTLPRGPWVSLSIDFYGPVSSGEYLLNIINEYSRYAVVQVVRSTSADTVIPCIEAVFAMFGYPETIKTRARMQSAQLTSSVAIGVVNCTSFSVTTGALHTVPHSSTLFTPHRLLFGWEPAPSCQSVWQNDQLSPTTRACESKTPLSRRR